MKSKKGLSEVVSAVLLISLTIVLAVIIGTMSKDVVEDNLDKSKSCFGIFEKILLNDEYTCYNSSANTTQVYIELKDFELDELLVSISFEGDSKSFKLTNVSTNVYGVYPYKGSAGTSVSLPSKEGAKTYVINETFEKPIKIQIAPTVNGNGCDVADTMTTIVNCA